LGHAANAARPYKVCFRKRRRSMCHQQVGGTEIESSPPSARSLGHHAAVIVFMAANVGIHASLKPCAWLLYMQKYDGMLDLECDKIRNKIRLGGLMGTWY
jgi:hypothetical protein